MNRTEREVEVNNPYLNERGRSAYVGCNNGAWTWTVLEREDDYEEIEIDEGVESSEQACWRTLEKWVPYDILNERAQNARVWANETEMKTVGDVVVGQRLYNVGRVTDIETGKGPSGRVWVRFLVDTSNDNWTESDSEWVNMDNGALLEVVIEPAAVGL